MAMVAIGAIAMATPSAVAATNPVPASCQTDLLDDVGLANNMLGAAQAQNFALFQLNSQASITINPSIACAPVLTTAQDNTLFGADEDLPVAESLINDGETADHATALADVNKAIGIFESTQSLLGLPVGGSVPEPTPPNPNVPQACSEDLEVWNGDSNNMLTATANKDVQTMENNLSAIKMFPAATDCASQLSTTQDTQLAGAEQDFVNATNAAKQHNFTTASTDVSDARTIVVNTQSALGLFITI